MKQKTYKALAFDFDGTLFDTESLNFRAYKLAYFDLGIEITPEMFSRTKGLSVYQFNEAMGVMCDVEHLRALKARYYKEYSLYARPNEYLIDLIKRTNLKKALVTTARRINIEPLLEKYDLISYFDVIVTQEDVEKHKPDPQAYQIATRSLDISPEDCLAFEDSRVGFVSAREAGYDCINIKSFYKDCISDMSGGSESRTYLLWDETCHQLVVKKTSHGERATSRLYNQYIDLSLRDSFYVSVSRALFSLTEGSYCMPYIIGTNFYQYQNKINMFPRVIDRLWEASIQKEENGNHLKKDIDVFVYSCDSYLIPGIDIYCKKLQIKGRDIGFIKNIGFLNDYRVTNYHGDATFENIIIQRDENIVFIDPVPDGNPVDGIVFDFAKLGQSLYGFESIRDHKEVNYRVEREIFQNKAKTILTLSEYKSLKFHIACLFFRRLKHQIYQNPELIKPYGDIGFRLLNEVENNNFDFI